MHKRKMRADPRCGRLSPRGTPCIVHRWKNARIGDKANRAAFVFLLARSVDAPSLARMLSLHDLMEEFD